MAVRHKTGLDYFPFDIDFFGDEKIEFVSARFGVKGELIAVKLLCKVYRNGYYAEWSDDEATIFAKRAGENITPALVNDVVEELAKRDFFDRDIFCKFKSLTSRGIQSRYFEAVERRKGVEVFEHLLLVDIEKYENVNILKVNVNISPKNDGIEKQSKVEESKEEESKVSGAKALRAQIEERRRKVREEYEQLQVTVRGLPTKDIWVSLKDFITKNTPDFADPYVDCWNVFVTSSRMRSFQIPTVKGLNETRRKKLNARISESDFDFFKILEMIKTSSLLKGDGNTTWKINFDWIIKNDSNYLKIIEGNYN